MERRKRSPASAVRRPPGSNRTTVLRREAMRTRGAELAERLVGLLPPSRPGLFNPWRTRCRHDAQPDGPTQRLSRLARHLDCDAKLILVGEAIGYQGGRYSGIAFTSERLLAEGGIPRLEATDRITRRDLPFSEPSATVVWRELDRLNLATHTVLWNALSLHPHLPGEPWSNRTPTRQEFEMGLPALDRLLVAFPRAQVVAVGRNAQTLLSRMCGRSIQGVRHPAYGGAKEFATGLHGLVSSSR